MTYKSRVPLFFTTEGLKLFSISRVIDTAAKQFTKTAITVTAIFIVALGYDLWYYVLGYSGVIDYKMNTPLQKIGKNNMTTGRSRISHWVRLKSYYLANFPRKLHKNKRNGTEKEWTPLASPLDTPIMISF